MKNNHSCIGVFSHHSDAEQAIKELAKSGFDMKKLSIVGKGYHSDEHPIGSKVLNKMTLYLFLWKGYRENSIVI